MSHGEKDALLADQVRLIQEMSAEIERLKAMIVAKGTKLDFAQNGVMDARG